MDPTATTPTPELEEESNQERLDREQRPGTPIGNEQDVDEAIFQALAGSAVRRDDALVKAIGFRGDREQWKRTLWRLHNEGYIRVRWVGLADPDPVEARLTERGRAWLSGRAAAPATAGRSPDQGGSTT